MCIIHSMNKKSPFIISYIQYANWSKLYISKFDCISVNPWKISTKNEVCIKYREVH